jgi:hypothetical protein
MRARKNFAAQQRQQLLPARARARCSNPRELEASWRQWLAWAKLEVMP